MKKKFIVIIFCLFYYCSDAQIPVDVYLDRCDSLYERYYKLLPENGKQWKEKRSDIVWERVEISKEMEGKKQYYVDLKRDFGIMCYC